MEKSKFKVKFRSSKGKKKKKESKQYMLLKNNSKRNHFFESLLKNVQVHVIFSQVGFKVS